MSDVRTLDYTGLTDEEAFDLWLTECPVRYEHNGDEDIGDGYNYPWYYFKVEKNNE